MRRCLGVVAAVVVVAVPAVAAAVVVAAAARAVDAARRPKGGLDSLRGIPNSCTSPEVFVAVAGRIVDHADRDLAMKLPKQGSLIEGCDIRPDMDAAYVVPQPSAQILLYVVLENDCNFNLVRH